MDREIRLAKVGAETWIVGWAKAVGGMQKGRIRAHVKLGAKTPRPTLVVQRSLQNEGCLIK